MEISNVTTLTEEKFENVIEKINRDKPRIGFVKLKKQWYITLNAESVARLDPIKYQAEFDEMMGRLYGPEPPTDAYEVRRVAGDEFAPFADDGEYLLVDSEDGPDRLTDHELYTSWHDRICCWRTGKTEIYGSLGFCVRPVNPAARSVDLNAETVKTAGLVLGVLRPLLAIEK